MPAFDSKYDDLKRILMLLDLGVLAICYLGVVWIYQAIGMRGGLDISLHLGLLPMLLIFFAISRAIVGVGLEIAQRTVALQRIAIIKELLFTFGATGISLFLLKLDHVSRLTLVCSLAAACIALLLMRRTFLWWYFTVRARNTEKHLRVLIVGSGRRARMLADQLRATSELGVHIVGFLDPKGESAGRRADDRILGHVDEISEVLRDNVVEDVIVAVPRSMMGDIQRIISACEEEGVRLRFMADIYDFNARRIRLSLVSGIPLLSFEPVARDPGALFIKRIFDFLVTLFALPFLVPLFAVIAVAIKLDSSGPVFYRQERVGLHKRKFKMFKFRSMVVDAESRITEVEHLNEADGPNFKIQNDPRMTGVGRFLRKTSLDELPQLLNVLTGEMSLVGPRPMAVRDVNLFDKGIQRKRFSVRPGITCLWQVSGRSNLSFDDWLALDLEYIESWSFWLDIRILLKTIPTVLRGEGAA